MLCRVTFLPLSAFLAITTTLAAPEAKGDNTVNIRIETNISTVYEGVITSGPRNITGDCCLSPNPEQVTVPCNGQGAGSNPGKPPGNTPVDALDAVAKAHRFTYDGVFDGEFNDFDINRIATTGDYYNESWSSYWGLLVNYRIPTFGEGLTLSGCQQLLNPGDDVLWAYITQGPYGIGLNPPLPAFLKLTPTAVTVKAGKGFQVTVTDGRTGNAIPNATVAGVKTNAKGTATLYFFHAGFLQYKAHRGLDVRSNVMNVTVTA